MAAYIAPVPRNANPANHPSLLTESSSLTPLTSSTLPPCFAPDILSYQAIDKLGHRQMFNNVFETAPPSEQHIAVGTNSGTGREEGNREPHSTASDLRATQRVVGGQNIAHQSSHEMQRQSSRGRSDSEPMKQLEITSTSKVASNNKKSVARSCRPQAGWVSELEGISERKLSEARKDGVQILTRREKVGMIRNRRRGNIKIDSRRKLMRREHGRKEVINSRRSRSIDRAVLSRPKKNYNSASALSSQLLDESLHSFSLPTLEEYLKDRTSARLQHENNADHGRPMLASTFNSHPLSACCNSNHNSLQQPLYTTSARKFPLLLNPDDFPELLGNTTNRERHLCPTFPVQSAIYGSGEGIREETAAALFERSRCGMPWHCSRTHHSKSNRFTDRAGTCFPVSKRRNGRSREGNKYSSGISVSSFDSELEIMPLMTEPEPFHEYSDDDIASSIEADKSSPCREVFDDVKSKRQYSKSNEEGKINGHGFGNAEESVNATFVRKQTDSEAIKQRSFSLKYRPKSFNDLVGQGMVAKSLCNAIAKGKIAPVYLFHGPRGTGKTSAGRIFTAAMNCLCKEDHRKPCGVCKECVAFHAGKNFDVREVDAARNNGIDSMRILLKHIALPPSSSRFKVFIIDECHHLTTESWNAFLKSLEEPPSYVVFILITADLEQLPRTAISRCQKFLFPRIKDSDIALRLRKLALQESVDIELEAIQLIASRSDGSLRDAETMLDQLSLIGKRVSSATVQELVGLIPDDKLATLLELALSADTVSTVKSVRQFMNSGVEPLALISQLATLITDILAGNCRIAIAECKISKVQKEQQEKLRQALRILSGAEKQLRSCSDKTTWLIAAFLQFAQNDFSVPHSSTLGTSVTQSPVNFRDTIEKDALHMDCAGTRKSWEGDELTRDSCFTIQSDNKQGATSKMETEILPKRLETYTNHFSGPFTDNKIHPWDQSLQTGIDVEKEKQAMGSRVSSFASLANSGQYGDLSTMSPCRMDDIWRKVLEGSRSNVLKQLLCGEGKLLSLSVTEDFAVAHLQFRFPEHKTMAEKAKTIIANAFQVALGCPVEIQIRLSSLQESFKLVHSAESPSSISGNPGNSRHNRITSLLKADGNDLLRDSENDGRQEQRKSRASTSFRNASSPFKIVAHSHNRSKNLDFQKSKQSKEMKGSTYRRSIAAPSNRDPDASTLDKLGKLHEEGVHILKSPSQGLEGQVIENSRTVISRQVEVQKGAGNSGRWIRPDDPNLQHCEDNDTDAPCHDQVSVHSSGCLKGKAKRDSTDKPRLSVSVQGDNTGNDVDKESSHSETRGRYGPAGLLCWKGTGINDSEVKHQRVIRKRRARFVLRLVPCAGQSKD